MMKQILHLNSKQPCDFKLLEPLSDELLAHRGIGGMPWATSALEIEDMEEILTYSALFRENCEHVIVCGTGGSSLGARTLIDLTAHPLGLPVKTGPYIHIVESTEPETLNILLNELPPEKTGWIFISKSGSTLETLTQFLAYLERREYHKSGFALVITMPGKRPLRDLALKNNITVLDHEPELGGRFSLFSKVGLLPAAIAGIDIIAIREGASSMLTLEGIEMASEAACWHMNCMRSGFDTQIVMPYAKRLSSWTLWYRQLWAESLGKQGKGSTPLAALGPVDHHSMLQLFLDGPANKCLTTICVQSCNSMAKLPLPEEISGFKTSHSGLDILNAQAYGTIKSFLNHGLPVREIQIETLNEYSLGALLMLGMLETVFTATLLEVNPFDQPAVEESKLIAFEQLRMVKDLHHIGMQG